MPHLCFLLSHPTHLLSKGRDGVHREQLVFKHASDLPGLIWSRMKVRVRLDRNQGGLHHAQETVTPEEILQHLRTIELDTGKDLAVLDACRKLGITEQRCGSSF